MKTDAEAIVRVAWARMLGLSAEASSEPFNGFITRQSGELIMFVRLWQREVLMGPAEFLDELQAGLTGEDLADGARLLALSSGWGGRLLGEATLAFCDEHVVFEEPAAASVTEDFAAVLELERACAPSDVAEVGLSSMSRTMVLVDELGQPTGGAGYSVWEQRVAHIGVLTSPGARRRGVGLLVAAWAMNDALNRGLVPQWRAQVENRASRRIAAELGFVEVGSQTTVLLNHHLTEPATRSGQKKSVSMRTEPDVSRSS